MNSLVSGIFASFEWFMRIVKLNVIWLLFSISGLFIFTLFPATIAAFAVTDQWMKGNVDVPVWNAFWKTFKSKFWRAQSIGYLLVLSFLIIYIDYLFFKSFELGVLQYVVYFVLFLLGILLMTITLYICPMIIENDQGIKTAIKTSLFTGLAFIHWTFINFLGVLGIMFVTYLFPAAFVFLTMGTTILWITCMNYIVKNKIETKYEKLNSIVD